jgi:hypothetical protein
MRVDREYKRRADALLHGFEQMGNCFRSGNGDDGEQGEFASRLAETTDAADANYMKLSTQMTMLQAQRDRIMADVRDLKMKEKKGVEAIQNAIRANKPIPLRFQPLHVRLQQLNNNLVKTDTDAAGIHQFMERIQLQRTTAASLSQQEQQRTMFASWNNLMTTLGVSTHTVIEDQAKLESAVDDMNEMRQAVQLGVHESLTTSSGGGGISTISRLLAETDDDVECAEELELQQQPAMRLGVWEKDSADTTVELAASRPLSSRASHTIGKRSTHELLGN